jgi:Bacterial SH3 domain
MVIVRSMSFRRADGPLSVHVPSAREDRPSWLGVGAIALVGFAIGVAWPRLAGVRLGPAVPESTVASAGAPESSAAPGSAPTPSNVPASMPAPAALPAASHGPSATASVAATAAAAPSEGPVQVSVGRGTVFACKSASGESMKGSQCGSLPGLDGIVQPRLRKLADCPQAAGASGRLHLVVRPDFAREGVTVELGRDRSIANADGLLACAKAAVAPASIAGIAHDNARYSVAYSVSFGGTSPQAAASGSPAAGANQAPVVADGTAQVEWEVAIVRDAPKTTGKVLTRLPRGTSLRVGAPKDGWYPVKYGDGYASDGWVYRGAIGK